MPRQQTAAAYTELSRQFLTATAAAGVQNFATGGSGHTGAKTMATRAHKIARLKGALHSEYPQEKMRIK